jgi:hypothetical protein
LPDIVASNHAAIIPRQPLPTVTHLCYFATVVAIGILLGIVIGQPKADAGVK